MTTYFSDDPDGDASSPRLITEKELETLIIGFMLGSGREPSLDQAKTVADWATKARLNSTLLDLVLDGELYAYCDDDGEMLFSKANQLPTG